jgi:hypothetical protein
MGAAAVWLAAALALLALQRGDAGAASVHTVFTTECRPYFTWQSLGAAPPPLH